MNILAKYTQKRVLADDTVDELTCEVTIVQFLGMDVGGLKAVCLMPDGTFERVSANSLIVPGKPLVGPAPLENMEPGGLNYAEPTKQPWWKRGN